MAGGRPVRGRGDSRRARRLDGGGAAAGEQGNDLVAIRGRLAGPAARQRDRGTGVDRGDRRIRRLPYR